MQPPVSTSSPENDRPSDIQIQNAQHQQQRHQDEYAENDESDYVGNSPTEERLA